MRIQQVADRIGKHSNTVRNYARQFSAFLSPEPSKGDIRTFTDDDVRILAFISRLSDNGMPYEDITQALKRKLDEGTPFPPVLPPPPTSEPQGLITVAEMESKLATKDAKIAELEARVEELRKQIMGLVEQHREERREEREEIGHLNQLIGELGAELKATRGK
jgi:DNA-binding transcriptional MerR regulator